MSLKLDNNVVFTIYQLLKGAAHRRRAAKQTPNYHTLASPNEPSPRARRATLAALPPSGWRGVSRSTIIVVG